MSLRNAVRAAGFAFCLTAWSTALADPVVLTLEGMRQAAVLSLNVGQTEQALRLADALLARDKADQVGLLVRARALRGLQRPDEAIQTAKSAWDESSNQGERYNAAMTMAQVLSGDGKRTRAQFWLRRAAQVAPSDSAKAVAIKGYQYVRSRNPLRLSFSASVAPSSNINNGSTATKLGQFTLTGAAVALSGVEASLGFSARYLLPPSEASQTELSFRAEAKTYKLSKKSQAQAPLVSGSDFAFAATELGVLHRRKLGNLLWQIGTTVGHNQYGGASLSNYLRVETGLQWTAGSATQFNLGALTERQFRLDGANRNSTITALSGSVTRVLPNQDSLRFSAYLRNTRSPATWIDHNAMSMRLDYARAEPVADINLSGGVSFETRDYDIAAFSTTGRQDRQIGVNLKAVFGSWDYMGFVPSLELNATRNNSNISLFERREVGVSFGIETAF